MTARRFNRRPVEVEAIQLDEGNAEVVAEWACGRVDLDDLARPTVRLPKTTIPVTLGDWAVRTVLPDGLSDAHPMGSHLFSWCYVAVEGEPHRHRRRDADEVIS